MEYECSTRTTDISPYEMLINKFIVLKFEITRAENFPEKLFINSTDMYKL